MTTMTKSETLQLRLDQAETALHDLLTGAQVVRVEYDGDTQEFTRSSEGKLRRYIRELKTSLGQVTRRSSSRTVTF